MSAASLQEWHLVLPSHLRAKPKTLNRVGKTNTQNYENQNFTHIVS